MLLVLAALLTLVAEPSVVTDVEVAIPFKPLSRTYVAAEESKALVSGFTNRSSSAETVPLAADVTSSEGTISTGSLSAAAVHQRRLLYGSFFVTALALLSVASLVVYLKKSGRLDQRFTTLLPVARYEQVPETSQGVTRGATEASQVPLNQESAVGLGALSQEEYRELEEARRQELHDLPPEAQKAKLAEWAQERQRDKQQRHKAYFATRWGLLVMLFFTYMVACLLLPFLHRSEATCSRGFFWETHMLFFTIFLVTKVVELLLCLLDPTLEFELSFFKFFIKFLPSFIGYFDGYGDFTSIIVAWSCEDNLAQKLALFMGVAYLVGVVILQWVVMFFFSMRDPSHACLMKLVHMDLLASCVTLPSEQKFTWDLIAIIRTCGEDVPQGILQTIYLVYVKRNLFMLVSVFAAVLSSVKALHDARSRALEAAGAAAEFAKRSREITLYSCSQDGTIKCWSADTGECKQVLSNGSPVNVVAATQGRLYTSHDDNVVKEWSLQTQEVLRTFEHPGFNATVVATAHHVYTWANPGTYGDGTNAKIMQWSLESGKCTLKFPARSGDNSFVSTMCINGLSLFATSVDSANDVLEFSVLSGDRLREFAGHASSLDALAATQKRLFSASQDCTVREWSRDTGLCTRIFEHKAISEFVTNLLIIGNMLFYAGDELDVRMVSLDSGLLLGRFVGHSAAITGMASIDGVLFTGSLDGTIYKWNIESRECLLKLDAHEQFVNNLIFQYSDA